MTTQTQVATNGENAEKIGKLASILEAQREPFNRFRKNLISFFAEDPAVSKHVHSVRSRMKDADHLRTKLARKLGEGVDITEDNVFNKITDFAGVRVLHLYQSQFAQIHAALLSQISAGEFSLFEPPKAYTWDPDASRFFSEGIGLEVEVKKTLYTSVHYVLKPRPDTVVTCEVQIRTLFEEVWGEVDHSMNYPFETDVFACKEQIKVLARFVAAGGRLVEAIMNTHAHAHVGDSK